MSKPSKPTVRCAIYVRKSTDHGLDQEFNSLDAQCEAAEVFIKSQAHEGWVCLPDVYSDGGFSGGNTDRPALKRLLSDIETGKVDCVVVQRVDRLSRSLLDFAKLIEIFERHRIAFASTTQQFNTGTSMGKLVMNMLMSFAEFERQIISERTRDKIAAARRRGKWSGGQPVLGYDVDPQTRKLIINSDESERVRQLFQLYIEHQGLLSVVRELDCRGWRNKTWTTKAGVQRGGRAFDKATLHGLLRNPIYAGFVSYKRELHKGEHQAIVDPQAWQRVQDLLQRNGRNGGAHVRNKHGALLKGLLRCKCCNCAMSYSYTGKRGRTRYAYYRCINEQKRGADSCPSRSLPAAEIEAFVVEQIKVIGRDPGLIAATLREARKQASEGIKQLRSEQAALDRDLKRHHSELRKLAASPSAAAGTDARIADLNERLRLGERRLAEIRDQIATLEGQQIDEREAAQALAEFTPVWDALVPRERARVIQLLVKEVSYDGAAGKVAISFHPVGLKTLAQERNKEAAA